MAGARRSWPRAGHGDRQCGRGHAAVIVGDTVGHRRRGCLASAERIEAIVRGEGIAAVGADREQAATRTGDTGAHGIRLAVDLNHRQPVAVGIDIVGQHAVGRVARQGGVFRGRGRVISRDRWLIGDVQRKLCADRGAQPVSLADFGGIRFHARGSHAFELTFRCSGIDFGKKMEISEDWRLAELGANDLKPVAVPEAAAYWDGERCIGLYLSRRGESELGTFWFEVDEFTLYGKDAWESRIRISIALENIIFFLPAKKHSASWGG